MHTTATNTVASSLPIVMSDRVSTDNEPWSYEEAFVRNQGLIRPDEQERLRLARVAIVGMGGMGGIDVATLARLGIGRFTIADPDVYEVANTNRQFGAMSSTIGRNKAEVMAEIIQDINPEAEVRVLTDPICSESAGDFLLEADLFVDAIEFFEIDVRRHLFRLAASKGIHAITAGPVGFSAVWIVFGPGRMSFDRYFDLTDDMSPLEKLIAFGVGVAPRATQRSYMDLEALDIEARTAPSCTLACQLAAGALACEATKILLGRGRVRVAPHYQQFDAYLGRFVQGRLRGGNRHPLQRIKRWIMKKYLERRISAAGGPSPSSKNHSSLGGLS